MKLLFLLLGTSVFAVLMYLCSTWYLQPLLVRQTVLRRLNLQSLMGRLIGKLPRRRASTRLQSELVQQLSTLSDLLDATARNLRLGRSMASSLQAAADTSSIKNSVITELVATTTRGESFADATKRLIPTAKTNELIFALRTIDLAATGGVGGVLTLEPCSNRFTRALDEHQRSPDAGKPSIAFDESFVLDASRCRRLVNCHKQ